MELANWLTQVREKRPLVHNITNQVVTNVVANTLLSVGASPVMAFAHEEVADMAVLANGLSLNMGTLTPDIITAMRIAGRSANDCGVPIVFDPVGIGATPYRTQSAASLIDELQVTVLRGNAGEIGRMVGSGGEVSGVDVLSVSDGLTDAMISYAQRKNMVVVATGPNDYVTDGETLWQLSNGHRWLSLITGSGCSLTGLLGAFVGVVDKTSPRSVFAKATIAAVTCLNVAGELAAEHAQGPGTFQAALFDALDYLTPDLLQKKANIEILQKR